MNRQQALDQLRLMQAWHEDFGNGPNADYDAICYAINIIEAQPERLDTLIKALEAEHKKLREMESKVGTNLAEDGTDCISRQALLDAITASINQFGGRYTTDQLNMWGLFSQMITELPSAEPQIIRCKDCKYWKRSSCCEGYCGEIDMEGFDEDHYCGYAERKQDG